MAWGREPINAMGQRGMQSPFLRPGGCRSGHAPVPANTESRSFFFRGRKLRAFSGVYPPSGDSMLLAESVSKSFLGVQAYCHKDSMLLAESVSLEKGCNALDLGTGSGIQGINAALLGAKSVVCTDISKEALENAEINAKRLGLDAVFEFRQGNMFECVGKNEKFGLIVFNPPYVESKGKRFTDLDGGKKGRVVLDCFLKGFASHLEKHGQCFFLQSSLNGTKKTERALVEQGLCFAIVARKRIFFEELIVFRARKRS